MGVRQMMKAIKKEFPHIAFGYFNPPEKTMKKYFKKMKA
jgi:acyl-coenzyme A synthetase/AMP-(fatty) acid ligase